MSERRSRNDLVIAMTLAEVFLLLLIVGWYGSRLESESVGHGQERPVDVVEHELEDAKQKLHAVEQQLQNERGRNQQMQRILDWLAKTVNFGKPIDSIPAAEAAMERFKAEARRGKPSCEPTNVLIDVIADRESTAVTLLKEFVTATRDYRAGQVLKSASDIETFLQEVDRYYGSKRKQGQDCVFDYSAAWRTDSDYRATRQMFEQHFYPARIRVLN